MQHEDDTDPIDRYVGERLRLARDMRELSQSYLGSYIGVSFQQIQKYEKGLNRISAGNLARFSRLLGVQVSYFYEGLPQEYLGGGASIASPVSDILREMFMRPETLELIELYYAIHDKKHRNTVRDVLKAMAREQPPMAPTHRVE